MKAESLIDTVLARCVRVTMMIALAAAAQFASAAEIQWNGNVSTAFSNANNWAGSVAPANTTSTNTGDIAVFGTSLTANQPELTAARNVLGLKFQKTDGGWTLGGPSYALGIGTNGIDDSANVSGVTTIKCAIANGNSGGFWCYVGEGGNLRFEGGLTNTANGIMYVNGGTVTLTRISANVPGRTFTKRGDTGTLAISDAAHASYQGTFNLQYGRLVLGHKQGMGTNRVILSIGTTFEASSDFTGADAISNNLDIASIVTFAGQHSIEFSGTMGNPGSGAGPAVSNTLPSGKKLLFSGPVPISQQGSASATLSVSGSGRTEFTGDISNGYDASRKGTVTIANTDQGITVFSGNNSYTGVTTVSGGVLLLKSANAIPGGIGTGGGQSQLTLTGGGIIGLGYNDFARYCTNVGYTTQDVYLVGSGGFAAYGADRTVNFGGDGSVVRWGGAFFPNDNTFILGHASADKTVTFVNAINLSPSATATNRTILVNDGAADVDGVLAGAIGHTGGGAHGIIKTGAGTLMLSASNAYNGATAVNEGVLRVNGTSGRGLVTVYSGASISGTGRVSNLTLQSGGKLRPYSLVGGMPSSLTVTGTLNVASGTLDLSGLGTLPDGHLTIATFNALSGSPAFAAVIPGPPDRQVEFTANSIVLKDVSTQGFLMLLR